MGKKTKVITVIIGAAGTISKSYRKYLSNIPGEHEIKELQERAILATAHILREVSHTSRKELTREIALYAL